MTQKWSGALSIFFQAMVKLKGEIKVVHSGHAKKKCCQGSCEGKSEDTTWRESTRVRQSLEVPKQSVPVGSLLCRVTSIFDCCWSFLATRLWHKKAAQAPGWSSRPRGGWRSGKAARVSNNEDELGVRRVEVAGMWWFWEWWGGRGRLGGGGNIELTSAYPGLQEHLQLGNSCEVTLSIGVNWTPASTFQTASASGWSRAVHRIRGAGVRAAVQAAPPSDTRGQWQAVQSHSEETLRSVTVFKSKDLAKVTVDVCVLDWADWL